MKTLFLIFCCIIYGVLLFLIFDLWNCLFLVLYLLDNGELVHKESPRIRGKIYEKLLLFLPCIHLPTFLVRKNLLNNLYFDETKMVGENTKFMICLSKIANFRA
jgi:hypothetical protein